MSGGMGEGWMDRWATSVGGEALWGGGGGLGGGNTR